VERRAQSVGAVATMMMGCRCQALGDGKWAQRIRTSLQEPARGYRRARGGGAKVSTIHTDSSEKNRTGRRSGSRRKYVNLEMSMAGCRPGWVVLAAYC